MADIKLALRALDKDIDAWKEAADELADASTSASAQDVPAGAFPINVPVDLKSTYDKLQEKVTTLVHQGAQEARDLAGELGYVRTTLTGTDEAVKDALEGLWDF